MLKENKVNRLSIGIQTFNERFSKLLKRDICKKDMIDKINLSKNYFDNINVDLMYALDKETIKELEEDLNIFLSLNVSHISTYCLIIEPNTVLGIKDYEEASDELQSKMYELICKTFKENGYNHYEISNFAKENYESKHNLTYWNNNCYYGFGAGASSFIDKTRNTNTKSVNNYINGKRTFYVEKIEKKQMMQDEVMLNLRKIEGLNKDKFYLKYNVLFDDVFDISFLLDNKLLIFDGKNIKIPEDKLFISNEIIVNIFDRMLI